MKVLSALICLFAASTVLAADPVCYVKRGSDMPEYSSSMYNNALASIPNYICVKLKSIDQLNRTVTYEFSELGGQPVNKTLSFSVSNPAGERNAVLSTSSLVSVSDGGMCDETVSVSLSMKINFDTKRARVTGQDMYLNLYYESNDNCHSSPEVEDSYKLDSFRDIAG